VWFILQLAAGVYLIHGRAGRFVVGAGRNGAEFSALLILCFVVIVLSAPAGYAMRRTR
jgi:putative oxidoreductase